MRYIWHPDTHATMGIRFPKLRINPSAARWRVVFEKGCDYVMRDPSRPDGLHEDQWDWNKGCGFSYDLLTNHKDSVMWSWRYNPLTQLIEVGLYAHVDGKALKFGKPLASVAIGDAVEINLSVNYEGKYYFMEFIAYRGTQIAELMEATRENRVDFTHKKCLVREINPWFGGQQKAPQRMSIQVDRII